MRNRAEEALGNIRSLTYELPGLRPEGDADVALAVCALNGPNLSHIAPGPGGAAAPLSRRLIH